MISLESKVLIEKRSLKKRMPKDSPKPTCRNELKIANRVLKNKGLNSFRIPPPHQKKINDLKLLYES